MVVASAFVLLMTPGLAFFYGGMVNRKNVISTMLQSFVALGVISVVWVVVGFSLCFGKSIGGIIGDPRTFLAFRGVRLAPNAEFAGAVPTVRSFPTEICNHYSGIDYRELCGENTVPGLHPLHGVV